MALATIQITAAAASCTAAKPTAKSVPVTRPDGSPTKTVRGFHQKKTSESDGKLIELHDLYMYRSI